MKMRLFANLKFWFLIWILSLSFWTLFAQYYYYDSWANNYQQGCSETLNVRINSQWKSIRWWRFHLILDPTSFSYSTSSNPDTLRTDLFNASSETFSARSAAWSPSRSSWGTTILQIDRTHTITDYNWTTWLYWTIKFIPLYNVSTFYWSFGMEYVSWSVTIETTLSRTWWIELIDPGQQTPRLTWTYQILQEPCSVDNNAPSISVSTPINWSDKQDRLSWISLSLTEAVWSNWQPNVPYIRSWWTWTWNPGWLRSNQYWIDLNTFNLVISWNWNIRTFVSWSLWLTIVWSWKTWQDLVYSYGITIDQAQLFDYWIEKTGVITTIVSDRKWNPANQNVVTFNRPVWPTLLWTPSPVNGAIFVNLSAPVTLGIHDNRAWVDSGSIRITLSWINWTNYWPYVFSGSNLNLSWVASAALQPDYNINISGHVAFPTSWTIRVIVYAEDMENNVDTISDYSFSTRPACSVLQCCDNIYIQIWTWTPVLYSYADLYVNYASWFMPTFSWTNSTWYLDCRETYYWISVYSGDWNTWTFLDQFTWTQIVFSWTNIKAILTWSSWNVVLLIRIWNFVIKVYPSNRSVPDLSNLWEIKFYNQSLVLVYSGDISTNVWGTWNIIYEVPPWIYYAVYKWQSHLSSYISGLVVVQNSGLIMLDFTTWENLYWTQKLNMTQDDWYGYQTAWDLKSVEWVYDYMVNGNDIAIIVANWLTDTWIPTLDPKNLNGDTAINASDIAVIWVNFQLKDLAFYADVWFQPFLNW